MTLVPDRLLSIAIMTVPERLQMADKLRLVLGNGTLAVNANIFIDTRYQGVWWNAQRAWSDAKAAYHMVIQDDCYPNFPDTFLATILPIINTLQNHHILSLFDISNQFIFKAASTMDRGLLEINRITTAQAIIMSLHNVMDFLAWTHINIPFDNVETKCDDERIACWQLAKKIPTLYPIPFPVVHLCGTGQSTIDNKHSKSRTPLPVDDGSPYPLILHKSKHKILASYRFLCSMREKAAENDTENHTSDLVW